MNTQKNGKRAVCWGWVLLLLAVIGCAGIAKRLEAPRVSLVDIAVKEIKTLETVFHIEMRILNPNDLDLVIKGMNCDLDVNGSRLASGVSDVRSTIPAYGTATVPVQVYSSVAAMFRGILNLQNKKTLHYQLKGGIRIEGGTLMPSVLPFKSEGELTLGMITGPPE